MEIKMDLVCNGYYAQNIEVICTPRQSITIVGYCVVYYTMHQLYFF